MSKNKLRFKDKQGNAYPSWQEKQLGDISNLKNGYAFSSKDYSLEGTYSVITISNVQGERYIDINGCNKIKTLPENITPHQLLKENDILITLTGNVGRVSICSGEKLVLNQRVGLLDIEDSVDRQFILHLLRNAKFEASMIKQGQGGAQPNISKGDVESYEVELPSLPEQQKIADFFSALDARIEKQSEKITSLKEYKKGLQQAVFGINGERTLKFKDAQGNDYPEWEEKTLGDISDAVGGGTPSTTNPIYWDGDINWFTPSELKTKYVSTSKRKITKNGLDKSSAKMLPAGAVLVSTRATLALMSILVEPAATNQGFQSLIAKSNTINEFIYYLQPFVERHCYEKASGSTFKEISKSNLLSMEILLPCLEEQTKIANLFAKVDQQIEKEEALLEKYKEQKQGFMQRMF